MPFTLSHPAAVLPLFRYGMPASALVIGSLTPDVPYYLPFPELGTLTHTPLGLPVNAAFGLAMVAGWHAVVAPAIVDLAPAAVRRRLGRTGTRKLRRHFGSLPRFASTTAAVAVGAATHIIWDWFTHADTVVTNHLTWLNATNGIPRHEWAQYLSSVAGVAAAGWWLAKWWRRQEPVERSEPMPGRLEPPAVRAAWAAIAAGAGLGMAHGVNAALAESDPVRTSLFYGATGGIRGGLAVLLAVALGLQLRGLRRRGPVTATRVDEELVAPAAAR